MSMVKKRIYLLRHGQAMHNIDKNWPEKDPPLTDFGIQQSKSVSIPVTPDLVVCSPMKRTIQTMYAILPNIASKPNGEQIPIEIWPNLREATNAPHNNGSPRTEISAAYPLLDFTRCNAEWDYEENTDETAAQRATEVIEELMNRTETDITLHSELRCYEIDDAGTMVEVSKS